MDDRRFLTRQNAGLNRRMDSNYIWPENFGTGARIQSETDIRTQKVHRNRMGREEIEIADIFCPPSQLGRIAPVSQKENSINRIDAISNGSRHSNVETRRKRLALETEKARQEIEMRQKELANEMALLELERDVREAELCDIEENGSVRSTYDIEKARNLYPNVRIVNPCENPLSSPVSEWTWPTRQIKTKGVETITEHENFVALTVPLDSNKIDFERFSKFPRITRTMAWVIRFRNILLSKMKHDNCEFSKMLSVSEIEKGEIELIRQSQYESFAEEIKSLLSYKELNGRRRLRQLSLMLNDDGLIVLDGRTNFSNELTFLARRPYMLHP
ncbi:hypothetical protein JTB14_031093 [Gonioctena quinquepunctata]|nr:hypothetical protein JTB14_031093 [Gonioctena quinquepunctata]